MKTETKDRIRNEIVKWSTYISIIAITYIFTYSVIHIGVKSVIAICIDLGILLSSTVGILAIMALIITIYDIIVYRDYK